MCNTEILNELIDRHDENEKVKNKYWDKCVEAMASLNAEQFEALRTVARLQGENSIIEIVVAMLTTNEIGRRVFEE